MTNLYLLRVQLENDYKHTFYFSSQAEQKNYFDSLITSEGTFTDFSYQRKEGVVRVPLSYEKCLKYNYVMYQNEDKWFYAFITKYEFKGEDSTYLTIQTDVIQTWLFDYNVLTSFIEREHVNDDTIGLHTVPENLEMGEYETTHVEIVEALRNNLKIVVGATESWNGQSGDYYPNSDDPIPETLGGKIYNGIYSGIKYYCIDKDEYEKVNDFLWQYDHAGINDSLKCMFIAPEFITKSTDKGHILEDCDNVSHSNRIYFELDKTHMGSLYTPRNNKLNCYPYKYLLASNNAGGSAIYQFEHFSTEKCKFDVIGALTPGCSIRMIPKDYKRVAYNDEEGLNLGKYPILNWTSDEYTNWLTQNSVNMGINLVTGVGQTVGGAIAFAATAGTSAAISAGVVVSGVNQIINTLTQVHQMSFTPPQSQGNINCGDVICSSGRNTFYFYYMSIKSEFLRIIDNFFDMYGYKANRVKIPNKNHRSRYWFTKTIDVNIKSSTIPLDDLNKIKDCYNNGITFWKDKTSFKDYTALNSIL